MQEQPKPTGGNLMSQPAWPKVPPPGPDLSGLSPWVNQQHGKANTATLAPCHPPCIRTSLVWLHAPQSLHHSDTLLLSHPSHSLCLPCIPVPPCLPLLPPTSAAFPGLFLLSPASPAFFSLSLPLPLCDSPAFLFPPCLPYLAPLPNDPLAHCLLVGRLGCLSVQNHCTNNLT